MCCFIFLDYVMKGLGYYSKDYVCDCVVKRYFIRVAERYVTFAAENVFVVLDSVHNFKIILFVVNYHQIAPKPRVIFTQCLPHR